MKFFKLYSVLILSILFTSSLFSANGDGGRDFEVIKHSVVRGDVIFIGNTVLCPKNNDGTCQDTAAQNDDVDLQTITDSSADLDIPVSDYDIKWAGIFWMGVAPEATTEATAITNFNAASAKTLTITTPDNVNHTPTWTADSKHDTYTKQNGRWFLTYQSYTEITDIVKSGGEGTYKINNLFTDTGATSNPDGNFGAWMIAVIYHDNDKSSTIAKRDISVFNGFKAILDGNGVPDTDFEISGFYTPRSENVNATMSIFTAEGDAAFSGDQLLIRAHNNPDTTDFTNIIYEGGNSNNVFVSGISLPDGYPGSLTRSPSLQYNYAIDLHSIEIGDSTDNPNTSQKIIGNTEDGLDVKIKTNSDSFYASTVVVSTEVYEPQFCYDYSYKQDNNEFTEDNNGNNNPYIKGSNLTTGTPVEVKIFIKNLIDSDLSISDLTFNVRDINTSQATYIRDTTRVANVGQTVATAKDDADWPLVVSDTNISNIPFNNMESQDYAYFYYKINPLTTSLDMPIDIVGNYKLVIDASTSLDYELELGARVDLCQNTLHSYEPANGIFNIVHNEYYNNTDSFYNLPTQIVNRAADTKVIALDYPSSPDTLKSISTLVAVEIINNSGFHYTDASCSEIESKINDKVWLMINGTSVDMNSTAFGGSFYSKATENAAFRVSYNTDEDGGLQLLECSDDNLDISSSDCNSAYKLKNFTSYSGEKCLSGSIPTVPSACGSNGGGNGNSGMDLAEVEECMECIYGRNTKFVCSRDNFSIRPEAFMIKIQDQNQTNSASILPILTNVSGVTTPDPSTDINHLASGYQYSLAITATDHISNNPSSGYRKSFLSSSSDTIEYQWTPGATTITGCNDITSKPLSHTLNEGFLETNSSMPEVGIYKLHVEDVTWTSVDSNASQMTHHVSPYFDGYLDCTPNISNTKLYGGVTQSLKNGCNISSNHDASYGGASNIKYRDYNLKFHPYRFRMDPTIIPSHGQDNNEVFNTNTFIYMTDMDQDEEMSFHLNGPIIAEGEDNSTLSNFVDECFAEPVSLSIDKTLAASTLNNYRYMFKNTDLSANDKNGSMNISINTIDLATDDFNKSNNGVVNTNLNLNFDRNTTDVQNPETLTFSKYSTKCTTSANCTMLANLGSRESYGELDLNQTIKHYYGRTHATRQRYSVDTDAPYTANLHYEVYCFENVNGNDCNKSLLQQGLPSKRSDDIRWFINESHTPSGGNAGTVTERTLTNVTATATTGGIVQDFANLTYDHTSGTDYYPYKTTMENNASGWLIYNKNDPTSTRNNFSVEFDVPGTGWSGAHETNTTTKDAPAVKTNRRSMW
ncbi:hypothetical protein N9A28_02385 [Sulfurimonas sp.]|nr:hypothetical protein [Sulfurimonas sp.]